MFMITINICNNYNNSMLMRKLGQVKNRHCDNVDEYCGPEECKDKCPDPGSKDYKEKCPKKEK